MTFRARKTIAALAVGCAVALTAGACSSGTSSSGSLGDPCKGELKESCGKPCSTDGECDPGLFCKLGAAALLDGSLQGACSAECTPTGRQCEQGLSCTSNGLCKGGGFVVPDGGLFGSTDGSVSTGTPDSCVDVTVDSERITPTVLLLIDRSGSMTAAFPDAQSNMDRWQTARAALFDQPNGVVTTLEDAVRFGMMLYNSENGGTVPDQCPILIKAPPQNASTIQFATGAYQPMADTFDSAAPSEDTPTGESLLAAADALDTVTEPGPKIIILVTDGEPDTCADPDAHNQTTNDATVAIAQGVYQRGIGISVIGISSDIGQAHLQAMANAGAGADPATGSETYYQPSDQQGLIDAFATIISGVTSCEFDLNGSVAPEDANLGHVTLGSQTLLLNDPNGWQLVSATRIELLGDACTQVKIGSDSLRISFPCGVVVPIVK